MKLAWGGVLLAGLMCFMAGSVQAECTLKKMERVIIEVHEDGEDDKWYHHVVVTQNDRFARDVVYEFEFDRLGGGGCLSLFTLPQDKLFGVHWDEGSAGTSSIYSRQMLYLWKVEDVKVTPFGEWVVYENNDGDLLTDRSFNFRNGRLNFEGREAVKFSEYD